MSEIQELHLSNYEIRAYEKRSGYIALYTRPYLFIDTTASFSVHAYLHDMWARLTVPGLESIEFHDVSLVEAVGPPYDGRTMVAQLWLGTVTKWRRAPNALAQLETSITFDIHGARFIYGGLHDAIIRWIRSSKRRRPLMVESE